MRQRASSSLSAARWAHGSAAQRRHAPAWTPRPREISVGSVSFDSYSTFTFKNFRRNADASSATAPRAVLGGLCSDGDAWRISRAATQPNGYHVRGVRGREALRSLRRIAGARPLTRKHCERWDTNLGGRIEKKGRVKRGRSGTLEPQCSASAASCSVQRVSVGARAAVTQVPDGNAERDGRILVGDELVTCSAVILGGDSALVTIGRSSQYTNWKRELIPVSKMDFDAIMAAIGSNSGRYGYAGEIDIQRVHFFFLFFCHVTHPAFAICQKFNSPQKVRLHGRGARATAHGCERPTSSRS